MVDLMNEHTRIHRNQESYNCEGNWPTDWSQLCNVCKQKWGLAPPRSMTLRLLEIINRSVGIQNYLNVLWHHVQFLSSLSRWGLRCYPYGRQAQWLVDQDCYHEQIHRTKQGIHYYHAVNACQLVWRLKLASIITQLPSNRMLW